MNPDVVIGVESWLMSSNQDKDDFPVDEYEVRRRDRDTTGNDDGHGGVFILKNKDLLVERGEELETDCELLWCYVQIKGSKKFHIGPFYRAHEGNEKSLKEIQNH